MEKLCVESAAAPHDTQRTAYTPPTPPPPARRLPKRSAPASQPPQPRPTTAPRAPPPTRIPTLRRSKRTASAPHSPSKRRKRTPQTSRAPRPSPGIRTRSQRAQAACPSGTHSWAPAGRFCACERDSPHSRSLACPFDHGSERQSGVSGLPTYRRRCMRSLCHHGPHRPARLE